MAFLTVERLCGFLRQFLRCAPGRADMAHCRMRVARITTLGHPSNSSTMMPLALWRWSSFCPVINENPRVAPLTPNGWPGL